MNDDPETTRSHPDEPDRSLVAPSGRRWFVLVPALTFLVGLLLGGLVIGVAVDGSEAENGASPDQSSADAKPGTGVVVPDACIEAAATVQQAISAIEDGVAALREFRSEEVIDLLDELEDLDTLAREQAATCQSVSIEDLPLSSTSASPTPNSQIPSSQIPSSQAPSATS